MSDTVCLENPEFPGSATSTRACAFDSEQRCCKAPPLSSAALRELAGAERPEVLDGQKEDQVRETPVEGAWNVGPGAGRLLDVLPEGRRQASDDVQAPAVARRGEVDAEVLLAEQAVLAGGRRGGRCVVRRGTDRISVPIAPGPGRSRVERARVRDAQPEDQADVRLEADGTLPLSVLEPRRHWRAHDRVDAPAHVARASPASKVGCADGGVGQVLAAARVAIEVLDRNEQLIEAHPSAEASCLKPHPCRPERWRAAVGVVAEGEPG